MKNNKEIKIAIIVAMIMITVCFIIIISNNASKNSRQTANEIKIYKHYDDGTTKEYHECKATTDDLAIINEEFRKIMLLDDEDKHPGSTINGTYRVSKGNNYIAFDGNDYFVYRGDTQAIYIYKSNLYDKVTELCK